ncbi:MAG: ribonuclease inhibitor [Methanosphaera sp.]|nr:ribonuclease inhibitor [Methanosphaera sp.]
MTKIELDGNKINENEIDYLKESFDLPVFDGDYEDIYQYLIGFYSKTLITLKNSSNVDSDLIDVFERASDYNELVKFEKLD